MSKLFETLLEGVDGALAGNYDLIKSKLTDEVYGKEWLQTALKSDEVNEDYDLYRNGDILKAYFFNLYWRETLELMINRKISCEDLRKFHDSQGVYFEEDFWVKLSESL